MMLRAMRASGQSALHQEPGWKEAVNHFTALHKSTSFQSNMPALR